MEITLIVGFGIKERTLIMVTGNEYMGNRGGIPLVVATQTTAGSESSNAIFSMPSHTFRAASNAGIIVINFNAATTTATGMQIEVNNIKLPLLNAEGDSLTSLTAGLHIAVFDKINNKLQLVM